MVNWLQFLFSANFTITSSSEICQYGSIGVRKYILLHSKNEIYFFEGMCVYLPNLLYIVEWPFYITVFYKKFIRQLTILVELTIMKVQQFSVGKQNLQLLKVVTLLRLEKLLSKQA